MNTNQVIADSVFVMVCNMTGLVGFLAGFAAGTYGFLKGKTDMFLGGMAIMLLACLFPAVGRWEVERKHRQQAPAVVQQPYEGVSD